VAKTDGQNTAVRRAKGSDTYIRNGFLMRNAQPKIITESIDLSSAPGGDQFVLTILEENSIVLKIEIYNEALGGGQISIGDEADASRYFDAFSVATEVANLQPKVSSMGYVIGTNLNDAEILATLTGGPLTGNLKAIITYV